MTHRMPSKWVYLVNEEKNYKELLTNKRSCPVCGEYRKIERFVTFIVMPRIGIVKPYICKSCGAHINIATGGLLDHVNERGRDYPIDPDIFPDIPLIGDVKIPSKDQASSQSETE